MMVDTRRFTKKGLTPYGRVREIAEVVHLALRHALAHIPQRSITHAEVYGAVGEAESLPDRVQDLMVHIEDRHAATQAALAAAENILGVIEEMGKVGGCWYEWEVDGKKVRVAADVDEALKLIRDAKGAEDAE